MKKLIFISLALAFSAANAELIKCKRDNLIFLQNYPCASNKLTVEAGSTPVIAKDVFQDPTRPPDGAYISPDNPIEKERREFLAHTASVIARLQQKLTPTPISHGGDVEYEDGITLSPLIIKKDHMDSIGYQWIVYKVVVRNDTDDGRKVYLRYKGIDNAGFKVDDINLIGTVPAHSSKSLTNDHAMKPSELIRIHEWVLDK